MSREQTTIQTSLRLTEMRNGYIKEKAAEIGIPHHAFILILIDLGAKLYEGEISINLHPKE